MAPSDSAGGLEHRNIIDLLNHDDVRQQRVCWAGKAFILYMHKGRSNICNAWNALLIRSPHVIIPAHFSYNTKPLNPLDPLLTPV